MNNPTSNGDWKQGDRRAHCIFIPGYDDDYYDHNSMTFLLDYGMRGWQIDQNWVIFEHMILMLLPNKQQQQKKKKHNWNTQQKSLQIAILNYIEMYKYPV